ncbi:MAG: hypothetical protein P0Y49_14070 [Candidatus Pedobacter colombiensis]|uniref:Uncharacterized protein n=1 Tax=Candidatus Pedobacter colombiensis TaxID=3121371 RepID=A0AAJ6B588_9SPHI|nr:hypothetical protein [Pedobacter sp.]WEK17925.1 MAG: hypothetical protein P0Y49_14070 [Pedobacter sp.]
MEDLRQLVKSMSGAEKRYFTVFSNALNKGGEETNYRKLYESLTSNESEVSEINSSKSKQVYTTAKKQLFGNILKSMRAYYQHKSPEIIIQNQLSEIEILYHLNLPQQSMLILQKAYALAGEHEKFGLQLQILDWERRLAIVLDNPLRQNSEIRKEEGTILLKLTQTLEMENIFSDAKELKKQYGYVKGKTKDNLELETIKAPGMPALNECRSHKATFYYHFIHALYYWMIFDHRKAYEYSQKLLEINIDAVPPSDYIDGILEHVTSCVCLGKFNDALIGLKVTASAIEEQKLHQSKALAFKQFYYQASYQIIIYNYTGNVVELHNTIKWVEEELEKLKDQIPFEARQVINGNLMNAYLGLGDWKKVNELWNSLFRKQSKQIRRDIYDDLYLFRLFNLIQNKTYALIPSKAKAAYRYYLQVSDEGSKTDFAMEMQLADIFDQEYDLEHKPTRIRVLTQARKIIKQYLKNLKGLSGFQEHYTFYAIWIESLISEIPFSEAAKDWYEAFKK